MRTKEKEMVNKDDFQVILQKKPFTPIRLHFSNGATHDITHPDSVLLSNRVAAIAVGDSLWLVAMALIVEVEPLAAVKA
jgi:hypothetical protein